MAAESPVSGFNPATLAEGGKEVFLDGRTFWADGALPVLSVLRDDWSGPFSPMDSNRAIAYWNTSAGASYRGWRLAGFYRGEIFMDANKDSLDIIRMINLKEKLPTGRTFGIDMSINGFTAKGVEISKGVSLDGLIRGLSAGVTARYLSGERVQEGTMTGSATATGPNTYGFDLNLNYAYDKNLVYKRKNAPPAGGNGYSFDFGVRYAPGGAFRAELLLRDIAGSIRWTGVPYSTANATSATQTFDSSGYQVYRPVITGFEGYKDFTQRIPLKTDVVLSYTSGPLTFTPTVNLIDDRPLYWMFLGYAVNENTSLSAGYNTNFQTVSLGAAYKKSMLSLYSSDINPARAASIGALLSIRYDW